MIGRPNAQNKARKGVLRQRQGGARRERSQKQNFFAGAAKRSNRPKAAQQQRVKRQPKTPPQKKRGEVCEKCWYKKHCEIMTQLLLRLPCCTMSKKSKADLERSLESFPFDF